MSVTQGAFRPLVSAACAGLILAALYQAGASSAPSVRRSSAPESVAVRVMFKSWGGELEQCTGPSWGWDSLTWRMRQGQPVPHTFMFEKPEFRIGRTFSADSAWLIYCARNLAVAEHASGPSNGPEWDSLVVSSSWSPTFTTVGVDDAQMWFRVRLVDPWPEPPRKPIKTASLRGSVVDDSTACAVYFCQVVIDGTKLSANTDSLGRFVLTGVPVGEVGVDACAGGYISGHTETRVPRDRLLIRLRRDPRVRYRSPCR